MTHMDNHAKAKLTSCLKSHIHLRVYSSSQKRTNKTKQRKKEKKPFRLDLKRLQHLKYHTFIACNKIQVGFMDFQHKNFSSWDCQNRSSLLLAQAVIIFGIHLSTWAFPMHITHRKQSSSLLFLVLWVSTFQPPSWRFPNLDIARTQKRGWIRKRGRKNLQIWLETQIECMLLSIFYLPSVETQCLVMSFSHISGRNIFTWSATKLISILLSFL